MAISTVSLIDCGIQRIWVRFDEWMPTSVFAAVCIMELYIFVVQHQKSTYLL